MEFERSLNVRRLPPILSSIGELKHYLHLNFCSCGSSFFAPTNSRVLRIQSLNTRGLKNHIEESNVEKKDGGGHLLFAMNNKLEECTANKSAANFQLLQSLRRNKLPSCLKRSIRSRFFPRFSTQTTRTSACQCTRVLHDAALYIPDKKRKYKISTEPVHGVSRIKKSSLSDLHFLYEDLIQSKIHFKMKPVYRRWRR